MGGKVAVAAALAMAILATRTARAASGVAGDLQWTTDTASVTGAPGSVAPDFSGLGAAGRTNAASTGDGVAIASPGSGGYYGSGNATNFNMVLPNGTTTAENRIFANNNSGGQTGTITFNTATSDKYFGMLINSSSQYTTVSVYNGNTLLLTQTLGSTATKTTGSIHAWSEFLNVSSTTATTFNKIVLTYSQADIDPNATVIVSRVAFGQTAYSAGGTSVPEPASPLPIAAGLAGIVGLGHLRGRRKAHAG